MLEGTLAENLVGEEDNIEGIIEDGGEEMDRGSDDESKKKDEGKQEEPKKRRQFGPRPVLNAERLKGPRGIATMEEFFSSITLDGRRGREQKDLNTIMKYLEIWTHRLYPRGQFDDCIKKFEHLGNKKLIRNYVKRIRLGMEDGSGFSEVITEEPNSPPSNVPQEDPFDLLVSSRMPEGPNKELTTEQRERMLRNRLIAEERRAARIKKAQELKERFKSQQDSSRENCSKSHEINEGVHGNNTSDEAMIIDYDENIRSQEKNGNVSNEEVMIIDQSVQEVPRNQDQHQYVSPENVFENSTKRENKTKNKARISKGAAGDDSSEEESITRGIIDSDCVLKVPRSQDQHEDINAKNVSENNENETPEETETFKIPNGEDSSEEEMVIDNVERKGN